jgi:hypothetical protein
LVADPQVKKRVTEKRLIFPGQKISLLALHTASPDPGWGLPVKSRKINREINLFLKIFEEQKKSWVLKWVLKMGLKMIRKKFSTR